VEATNGPKIAKLLRVKYVYETTGVKVLSHLETLRNWLGWLRQASTFRHHAIIPSAFSTEVGHALSGQPRFGWERNAANGLEVVNGYVFYTWKTRLEDKAGKQNLDGDV
jgi:hypothetical protein